MAELCFFADSRHRLATDPPPAQVEVLIHVAAKVPLPYRVCRDCAASIAGEAARSAGRANTVITVWEL